MEAVHIERTVRLDDGAVDDDVALRELERSPGIDLHVALDCAISREVRTAAHEQRAGHDPRQSGEARLLSCHVGLEGERAVPRLGQSAAAGPVDDSTDDHIERCI